MDDRTTPSKHDIVPALHVLFTLPLAHQTSTGIPAAVNECEGLRRELIDYLAAGLGGDMEAAEWVLFALMARMYVLSLCFFGRKEGKKAD